MPPTLAIIIAFLPSIAVFTGLLLAPFFYVLALISMFRLWRSNELQSVSMGWTGRLLLILTGYAIFSLFWTPELGEGARAALGIGPILLGGFALVQDWKERPPPHMDRVAVLALLLGLLSALTIIASHGALWELAINQRVDTSSFNLLLLNRGAAVLSLFFWPALHALERRGKLGMGLFLGAMTFWVLLLLENLSAIVAMGIGMLIYSLLRLAPKAFLLLIPAVIAMFAAFPFFALGIHPAELEARYAHLPASALHRLHIWHFAAENIVRHPIFGWGVEASRAIPGGKAFVHPGLAYLPLHPHNSILQLWLELGVSGLFLGLAAVVALLWKLRNTEALWRAAAGAAITAYLTIGWLGFSIWQSWWVASAFLTAGVLASMIPKAPPASGILKP